MCRWGAMCITKVHNAQCTMHYSASDLVCLQLSWASSLARRVHRTHEHTAPSRRPHSIDTHMHTYTTQDTLSTHSLTHSLTHSHTHSHTHTHTLTYSHSHTYHALTHSLTHLPRTHSLTHTYHALTHSFVHSVSHTQGSTLASRTPWTTSQGTHCHLT